MNPVFNLYYYIIKYKNLTQEGYELLTIFKLQWYLGNTSTNTCIFYYHKNIL